MKHICTVLSLHVGALQQVAERTWKQQTWDVAWASSLPVPQEIVSFRSDEPLGSLTLDEITGIPYLVVVRASKPGVESLDQILCVRLFGRAFAHEQLTNAVVMTLRQPENYPDAVRFSVLNLIHKGRFHDGFVGSQDSGTSHPSTTAASTCCPGHHRPTSGHIPYRTRGACSSPDRDCVRILR